jgi:hypothetical protein
MNTGRTQNNKISQTGYFRKQIIQGHKNIKLQALIRCMQVNLQNSKTATDNLMKLAEEENSDLIYT